MTLEHALQELASAERFEERALRHFRSCPPRERSLAQAQWRAAQQAVVDAHLAVDEATVDDEWDNDELFEARTGR